MSRAHITCREIMRAIFTRVGRVFGGAVLIAALVMPAHAQAFADRLPTHPAFTNVFRLNSTTMLRIATD